MKQGSAKKQSRTYNNNNAAQGFQGGKVIFASHFKNLILYILLHFLVQPSLLLWGEGGRGHHRAGAESGQGGGSLQEV